MKKIVILLLLFFAFFIYQIFADTVTITSPVDNHDTNVRVITIQGTANSVYDIGDSVHIYTNNILQSSNSIAADSSFSGTAALTGIGNIIVTRFYDGILIGYDTIHVDYYDTSSIGVAITYPLDNHDTNVSIVIIGGTTANCGTGSHIHVYVDGAICTSIYFTLDIDSPSWCGTAALNSRGESVSVLLESVFGDVAQDTITIDYWGNPGINITLPANNSDTDIQIFTIYGTTNDAQAGDTIQIYTDVGLNTTIVIVDDTGNWSGTACVSNYGESVIVIFNGYSGTARDTITVNYFSTPTITINYPGNNHDTNTGIINIGGSVTHAITNDTVVIYTNATYCTTVIVSGYNGSWAGTVSVSNLNDSVWVVLHDQFGRTATDTNVVNYYNTPSIGISYPTNNHDTNINIVNIGGTTAEVGLGSYVYIYNSAGDSTDIFTITADSQNWSGTVSLFSQVGDSVMVILIDQFGVKVYDTITIKYWGIANVQINEPSNNHDTIVNIITINGTTYGSKTGDTVVIYTNTTVNTTVVLASDSGNFSGTAYISNLGDSVWVIMYNQFNARAYDTIVLNFIDTPLAGIIVPEHNSDTNLKTNLITGTTVGTSSGDTVVIYVNNVLNSIAVISGYDNNFSGTAYITNRYDSITVEVHDQFGRNGYDTINVSYVEVQITSPSDGTDTNTKIANVSGTTYNTYAGDTVYIYCDTQFNCLFVLLSDSGNFSGTVSLQHGNSRVWVKILTDSGNIQYDTISVGYFAQPQISFSMIDEYDTNTKSPTFIGTTYNTSIGDTIKIYVGSSYQTQTNLTADSGSWGCTVALSNMSDSVWVKLETRFDSILYDTISVFLHWAGITNITNNTDTNSDSISNVNIDWVGNSSNDTIYLYVNSSLCTSFVTTNETGTFNGTATLTGQADKLWLKMEPYIGVDTNHGGDSVAYDTITINYFANPVLTITYPADNHDTYISIINIGGTSYDVQVNDTVEIFVNNVLNTTVIITSLNGNFFGTAAFSDYGSNLVVKLHDQFGRNTYDTIVIDYFKTPDIAITSPANNHDTYLSTITISGTTVECHGGDTVEITNMYTRSTVYLLTGDSGTWSGTVAISGYNDSIVAILHDTYNRTAYDTISINYFGTPNIGINLSNPTDTNIQKNVISGTSYNTRDSDLVRIYVNTILQATARIVGDSGNWVDTPIIFVGIGDSLVVKLEDSFGRVYYETRTINYYSIPTIQITVPADNHDTNNSFFIIGGIASPTKAGDTVEIYTNTNLNTTVVIVSDNANWSGTAGVSSKGDSLWVVLHDSFGNILYDTITVNKYQTNPGVGIDTPATAYDTCVKVITIYGTSKSSKVGDRVRLYVNGILNSSYTLTADTGSWSGTVSLTNIGDSILARLTNFDSDVYDTITINYIGAPSVVITNFPNNHDTNIQIINVICTTKNTMLGDTIYIYVDNVLNTYAAITYYNQSFSGTAALSETSNNVSVKLVTALTGSVIYDTITVDYYGTILARISYPSNNTDTKISINTIHGTTVNSRNGDTIVLRVNGLTNSITHILTDSGTWSGTVVVGGSDSISVTLEDQFGRTVGNTVTISYYATPTISIGIPGNVNTDTNISMNWINGTTEWSQLGDTISIYVNNILNTTVYVVSDSMSWSGTVVVVSKGDSVTVKLESVLYKTSYYDTITISYYPVFTMAIMSPDTGHDTNISVITISGTTENSKVGDTVQIFDYTGTMNTNIILTSDSGSFSGTCYIAGTPYPIVVAKLANSFNNNLYNDTIQLHYLSETLSLEITYPVDNHDTNTNIIIIGGTTCQTVANVDTVYIYVNNVLNSKYTISADSDNWNGTVYVSSYGDSVSTKLVNQFGQVVQDTITVNCFANNPEIVITSMIDNNDTNVDSGTIFGTSNYSIAGDTLLIFVNSNINDTIILTENNENWSGTFQLNGIGDSVWVKLYNRYDSKVYDTITFSYVLPPSYISITYPDTNSHDTIVSRIIIMGTTRNTRLGDTVQIYVNSVLSSSTNVVSDSGSWIGYANLEGKGDSVIVKLIDQFGQVAYDSITVNFSGNPRLTTYPKPYMERIVQNKVLQAYWDGKGNTYPAIVVVDIHAFNDSTIAQLSAVMEDLYDSGLYEVYDSQILSYATNSAGSDSILINVRTTHRIYIAKTAVYTIIIERFGVNGSACSDGRVDEIEKVYYTVP